MKPLRSPGVVAPELTNLLEWIANDLAAHRDDWREEIDAARPHLDPDAEWIVPYVDLRRGEPSGLRTDDAAWLEAWTRLAKTPTGKAAQTIKRLAGFDSTITKWLADAEDAAIELRTSLEHSENVATATRLDDADWAVRRVRAAFRLWRSWIIPHPLEREPIESESIVGQLGLTAEDLKHHAEAIAIADEHREQLAIAAGFGFTAAQLCNARGPIGADTFNKIRKAAGVPSPGRGWTSAKHRYTPADVENMADVVESGGYVDGENIAKAWRLLIHRHTAGKL
jgi:hypothetical protein